MDSKHFHITLFKEHRVEPRNYTSVSVVFLPRSLGPVDANLVVESNFGRFVYPPSHLLLRHHYVITATTYVITSSRLLSFLERYKARGYGIPNPYKLHPIVGAKVPFGVPYSPPLLLYNPRSHPIKVFLYSLFETSLLLIHLLLGY